jgi:AraC family transcriptional regulator
LVEKVHRKSPNVTVAMLPFSPRLFFEDNGLWDVALRLTTLIEGSGLVRRLYVEALGVLMAHELIRLHSGEPAAFGGTSRISLSRQC